MRKKIKIFAAVLLMSSFLFPAAPGFSQQRRISPNVRLPPPAGGRGLSAVDAEDEKQTRRIEGKTSVPGATNIRDAAEKYLRRNARELGIAPIVNSRDAGSGLRVVDEKKSLTGTHLTYRQFYNNLPVFNEQLKVSVNKNLQITQVSSDVEPVGGGSRDVLDTIIGSSEADAIKAAIAAVKATDAPVNTPKAEVGIITSKDAEAATVYRVTFSTKNPGAAWVVLVDAKTLEVLSVKNVARYAVGRGMVFKPNPIISSGLTTFKDNNDANSIALNKQRVSVVLQDLDTSGTLSGTYATTKPTRTFRRAFSKLRNFNYLRADDRFEEVMSYYYVTETSRYVQSLGFDMKEIMGGRALPIDVNFENIENAFFDPIQKQLAFGSGSVDTAEDATVIVHEFGHALLDFQAPNFDTGNSYTEGGAMHEGFGDYLSASFFAGSGFQKGVWSGFLGSWFAAGIPELSVGKAPPYLRSMNNTKHYPENLDEMGEPHNSSEIWSGALWDIFKKLGKKPADTLIIESNFRLNGAAKFADAANNILAVDKELYEGRNQTVLREIFAKRGILK